MTAPWATCGERAPGPEPAPTTRCNRPVNHVGVHAIQDGRGVRDTWPRWQDVVDLKRRNGTL